MKVAINRCYGGFSLSPLAIQRLCERRGRPCFFFTQDIAKKGMAAPYDPVTVEEAAEAFMFSAFDVPNPGEVLREDREWSELTMDERKAQNERYAAHSIGAGRDVDRSDPDVIAVIEELGEAANGRHAQLAVVEIPDGVEFVIDEYDGIEHIAEVHRTWR